MKIKGRTWVFFCGYNLEVDCYEIRLSWGGLDKGEKSVSLWEWRREKKLSVPRKMNSWLPRLKFFYESR